VTLQYRHVFSIDLAMLYLALSGLSTAKLEHVLGLTRLASRGENHMKPLIGRMIEAMLDE
jgi:hypothetical protein